MPSATIASRKVVGSAIESSLCSRLRPMLVAPEKRTRLSSRGKDELTARELITTPVVSRNQVRYPSTRNGEHGQGPVVVVHGRQRDRPGRGGRCPRRLGAPLRGQPHLQRARAQAASSVIVTIVSQGSLSEFSAPRLFATLAGRAFTGELVIAAGGRDYQVAWEDGAIVGARSPHPADSAAKIAVTLGVLSSTQAGEVARLLASAPGH
ncbi:MAG: DUF4388 domain-containing protein, partial [Kofleriaceae bacterium]